MTDTSDFSGLTAAESVSHDRGLTNHREDPRATPAEAAPEPQDTRAAWRAVCTALFTTGSNPDLPTPEFERLLDDCRHVHNARVIGDGAMLKIWEAIER